MLVLASVLSSVEVVLCAALVWVCVTSVFSWVLWSVLAVVSVLVSVLGLVLAWLRVLVLALVLVLLLATSEVGEQALVLVLLLATSEPAWLGRSQRLWPAGAKETPTERAMACMHTNYETGKLKIALILPRP